MMPSSRKGGHSLPHLRVPRAGHHGEEVLSRITFAGNCYMGLMHSRLSSATAPRQHLSLHGGVPASNSILGWTRSRTRPQAASSGPVRASR